MSFQGLKQRGMRAIVKRETLAPHVIELTLECGHKVTRSDHHRECTSAVCSTCKRSDGAKRDADKARREAGG